MGMKAKKLPTLPNAASVSTKALQNLWVWYKVCEGVRHLRPQGTNMPAVSAVKGRRKALKGSTKVGVEGVKRGPIARRLEAASSECLIALQQYRKTLVEGVLVLCAAWSSSNSLGAVALEQAL